MPKFTFACLLILAFSSRFSTCSAGDGVTVVGGISSPSYPPTKVESYLLIDDFSGIDTYTRDPYRNPYWESATGTPYNPFHINTIGYWTSGYDDSGYTGFDEITDAAGYLKIKWGEKLRAENRPFWYWYTSLEKVDLRNLYLTFRIKGETGGENCKIKIAPLPDYTARNITNYITITNYWQKATIPLSSLSVDYYAWNSALVFLFDTSGIPTPGASATVYIDDITLEVNPDSRVPSDGLRKPVSAGSVKVIGRKLYVQNRPFYMRGVGYSPTPIGETPAYGPYFPFTRQVAERDFPLIKAMGANTVKTWGRFDLNRDSDNKRQISRDLLDFGANAHHIKVCAGFWIPHEISFCNDWAKQRLKEDFRDYVRRYKYEPELLMWVIGNENNMANGYDWRWYQFANELAKIAYEEEGNTYHPVAIVEADIAEAPLLGGSIGIPALLSDDANLNYVDIIGINVYRGKYLGNFFATYAGRTKKPLWISEYGIDAWYTKDRSNPSLGYEAEQLQSDWNSKIWLEVNRYAYLNVGAAVMEYSDEWWKDNAGDTGRHDYGGFHFTEALPDRFMNEEWWGLARVAKDASAGIDTVTPREAFYRLYSLTVGGKIKATSGTGIPGALVVLRSCNKTYHTYSDAQGLYAIQKLVPGKYIMFIYKSGFVPQVTSVILPLRNQAVVRDAVLHNTPQRFHFNES